MKKRALPLQRNYTVSNVPNPIRNGSLPGTRTVDQYAIHAGVTNASVSSLLISEPHFAALNSMFLKIFAFQTKRGATI